MINEYAVDPGLLNSWDMVRFYLDKFGIDQGRLLAQYPSGRMWASAVLGKFPFPPPAELVMARKFVSERLAQIVKTELVFAASRVGVYWNPTAPWAMNAEQEHIKRAFHAIVARDNPGKRPHVIVGDDIAEQEPPALWRVERSREVPRTGAAMADVLTPLFGLARTVLFVDRYFSPLDADFCNVLADFLQRLVACCRDLSGLRVEYHTGDSNPDPRRNYTPAHFVQFCQTELPPAIPTGLRVRFVRWRFKEFHDRFVITDRAAVMFGQGLDEAGSRGEIQTVRLTLLDTTAADRLREDFLGAKPRYTPDPGGTVEVTGTRTV